MKQFSVVCALALVPTACGPSTAAQKADVNAGVAAAANLLQSQGRWSGTNTVTQNATHQIVEDDRVTHKSISNQSVMKSATSR